MATSYKRLHFNSQLDPGLKKVVISLQDYLDLTRATHTEQSEVGYVEVRNAVSDNRDTINNLHTKFIKGKKQDYLVIVGDQKL